MIHLKTMIHWLHQSLFLRASLEFLKKFQGALTNLKLFDSYDWFTFTLPVAGDANSFVSISFANSLGNLDLALYNGMGQMLRSSNTTFDAELISLNGLAPATYFVRISGANKAFNNNYTLAIDSAGPLTPIPPPVKTIDLYGASLNATDGSYWGKTINATAQIGNLGTNATAGNVRVSYYLSRDIKNFSG